MDPKDPNRVLLVPPSDIVQGISEAVQNLKVYIDQGTSSLEFKLLVHRIGEDTNYSQALYGAHG